MKTCLLLENILLNFLACALLWLYLAAAHPLVRSIKDTPCKYSSRTRYA